MSIVNSSLISNVVSLGLVQKGVVQENRFTPADLFGASESGGWYDPSDLSTMFQDDLGTIPVTSDGDPVGRIEDKSGNGAHATQVTTSRRPIYRTNGYSHWLEFDGVDDGFDCFIPTTGPVTLAVGTTILTDTPTGTRVLVSPESSNYLAYSGSSFSWFDNENELGIAVRSPTNSITLGQPSAVVHRISDTFTDIWDDYKVYSYAKTLAVPSRTYSHIGAFSEGSAVSRVRMFSIVIINRAITDEEAQSVSEHLFRKVGG